MDELDQVIDKAMAEGLSDEDIQFIVAEWRAQRPMPAGATAGMTAQSTIAGGSEREANIAKIAAAFDPANLGRSLGKQVLNTALTVAVPGVVSKGASIVKPALGAIGKMLEEPAVGGVAGGLLGYQQGGARGAVEGAVLGAAGGGLLGRLSKLLGGTPKPPMPTNTGGRLAPKPKTLEDHLAPVVDAARKPVAVEANPARTQGGAGGYTTPKQGADHSVRVQQVQQEAKAGREAEATRARLASKPRVRYRRGAMGEHGDEYAEIRANGGAFNDKWTKLTPEEQAAAPGFWDQLIEQMLGVGR